MTVTAGDPVIMLEEPIRATRRALERAGMTIGDIDIYEVNEAFAPVPLAWLQAIGGDPAKLNVNGGAIALGHPLGERAPSRWRPHPRAARAWAALRPPDYVRGRRHRQRHHRRSAVRWLWHPLPPRSPAKCLRCVDAGRAPRCIFQR